MAAERYPSYGHPTMPALPRGSPRPAAPLPHGPPQKQTGLSSENTDSPVPMGQQVRFGEKCADLLTADPEADNVLIDSPGESVLS